MDSEAPQTSSKKFTAFKMKSEETVILGAL
jgi:hypothetical protein